VGSELARDFPTNVKRAAPNAGSAQWHFYGVPVANPRQGGIAPLGSCHFSASPESSRNRKSRGSQEDKHHAGVAANRDGDSGQDSYATGGLPLEPRQGPGCRYRMNQPLRQPSCWSRRMERDGGDRQEAHKDSKLIRFFANVVSKRVYTKSTTTSDKQVMHEF
jgi:hypothetical protein